MREIHDHKSCLAGDPSDNIRVLALDERGPGNANHEYVIEVGNTGPWKAAVYFQKGPLQESSFNGVSNEAVLAIVIDRLRGFQSGPFACPENGKALACLEEAMVALHSRTKNRMLRHVEGPSAA